MKCFISDISQGVKELRNMVISQTLAQKYMGEKIPQAWLSLEESLKKYKYEKKVNYLPFKTLETLGATCGVFDRGEVNFEKKSFYLLEFENQELKMLTRMQHVKLNLLSHRKENYKVLVD